MNRRFLSGLGLGAAGLVLAGVQLVHAVQQTAIPVAIAVDAVPFVAMGLALSYAGGQLARDWSYEETATRVVAWSVGATVAFAAVAALLLFSQQVTTGGLGRATYLTADIVTAGALTGVLVGLYDAQSRTRLEALEAERDRVAAFGQKAADVNSYGRAIASAGSADAIAAYIVEAISSLTGIDETAVLRMRDDEAEFVANTVRTADAESVAELARGVCDQSVGDVVAHKEMCPIDLGPTVSDVLTAVVSETGAATTVVVAVATSDSPTEATEQKLLELVVAHATVRLERLGVQPVDAE